MEGICLALSPFRKIKSFTLEKIVIKFLFSSVTYKTGKKNYSSKWIYTSLFKQDMHFLTFLKQTI